MSVAIDLITSSSCASCERSNEKLLSVLARVKTTYPDLVWQAVDIEQDRDRAMKLGVMSTPAVIIDGQVAFQGGVPSEKRLKKAIRVASRA